MKTLTEHLRQRKFERVYLLFGDEAYLRLQYRDRLIAALLPEGDTMNLARFEGKKTDESQLMAVADTLPFFSDYRVVVAENTGFFAASGHEALAEYVKNIPESSCLIFVEEEVDKRNKLFKAVSSAGYAANLSLPGEKQLARWLGGMAAQAGKQIHPAVLAHFIEIVMPDMSAMKQEMVKLISYVGDRPYIDREDVDAVCSVHVENKIFDMVRAVAEKQPKKALALYEDLLTLREPPMRILFLMNKQFAQLMEIRELQLEGCPPQVIADRTGIRDFIVRRMIPLGGHFELSVLREAFEYGLSLDEAIKTGRISDQMAVEIMILRYSQ